MKLLWSDQAWQDYLYWQRQDRDVLDRINSLVRDIRRSPYAGIGKPELLRGDLSGWWSRRITAEHRIVYRLSGHGDDPHIEIITCRYHYSPRR